MKHTACAEISLPVASTKKPKLQLLFASYLLSSFPTTIVSTTSFIFSSSNPIFLCMILGP